MTSRSSGPRVGSVCTGIGGLDLGFERAGFEIAWMAEIDPWASRVLAKRWPGVPNVGDWTERISPAYESCVTGESVPCGLTGSALGPIDLLIGGIPCQGHSVAGRRGGKDDERNLWPAFAGLVDTLRPVAFVIENVPGLLTSNDGDFFAEVLEDCDRLGYAVEWDILSAAAVGAPHRRERVFIVGRRDGRQTWPQREQQSMFPGRPQSWPKAGRWTDGYLFERERQWPTASRPGWTTPRAGDSKQGHLESGDLMLTDEVRLWATPEAVSKSENIDTVLARQERQKERYRNGGPHWAKCEHLEAQATIPARLWPSATVEDSRDSGAACYSTESGRHSGVTLTDATRRLPAPQAGRLSPDWTETLMGLPVGWTDPSCDEPEPRPYPLPMACGDEWPTPQAYSHDKTKSNPPGVVTLDCVVRGYERGRGLTGPKPLYGASPQAPWEPPRLVEPVKGDGRRHRLRCIGNAVVPDVAEVIARSLASSLAREEVAR